MNWKKWVEPVCSYYNISEDLLLKKNGYGGVVGQKARQTFYHLCFRDGISLYKLSLDLGKERTTVLGSVNKTKLRDVEAEKEIMSMVKRYSLDQLINLWLGRKANENRDIILVALIRQKQFINLDCEGIE